MRNVSDVTQEPPRPVPGSTFQVAGQTATDVVNGLKQQPTLLALVCLNVIAIGAAVWILKGIQEASTARMERMLTMIEKCMGHIDQQQ